MTRGTVIAGEDGRWATAWGKACPPAFSLTVTRSGPGTGTVTSAPLGIDCGSTCVASFHPGTLVTLSAVATSGSLFNGWSGAGCTGTGSCQVTMDAAKGVTASFIRVCGALGSPEASVAWLLGLLIAPAVMRRSRRCGGGR